MRPGLAALLGMAALITLGCQGQSTTTPTSPSGGVETPTEIEVTGPTDTDVPVPPTGSPKSVALGYTHQRADGNRVVSGKGSLPDVEPLDVALAGPPRWLVAAPQGPGTVWVAVLEDGKVQAFAVKGRDVQEIAIEPPDLGDLPPVLRVSANGTLALLLPPDLANALSPPAALDESGSVVFAGPDGSLILRDVAAQQETGLAVRALPDARLLVDEQRRILFLSDPTTRYDHGVLGDRFEAATITLVETQPQLNVALTISIPEPQVVEGISPLWADLNGDGRREIIVTVSDAESGARIAAFDETGALVAEGPAIGRGFRWRHQIAVAPFGPSGEIELADVLTPHIGGVVEFYRLVESELRIVAQVAGYTSHVIGTRNLDMAAAGDLDGDGRVELLLPNQARSELGAIRRTVDGAAVVWTLSVGAEVNTNIAAVTFGDARLAVGVGRTDGSLRLWLP